MSHYVRIGRDPSLALSHEELMREREALGLGPYAERRERERDPEPKPEPPTGTPKCQHCGRPVKPGETLCKRCPRGRVCQGKGCKVSLRGEDSRMKYCRSCAEAIKREQKRTRMRQLRERAA